MLKMSVNTFNKVRSSISSKRITNIFLKKKKKRNALVETILEEIKLKRLVIRLGW